MKNRRNTVELPETSLRVTTQVNLGLVIVFARLLFQHGAGNCKKGYWNALRLSCENRRHKAIKLGVFHCCHFGHFAKAIVDSYKMVDFGNEVLINRLDDRSACMLRKLARVNDVNTVTHSLDFIPRIR